MASALVNSVALSPPSPADSFPWINPRISFSYDLADPQSVTDHRPCAAAAAEDFEFLLDNPVTMLPAEELFSGGKLVPLQMAPPKASAEAEAEAEPRVTEIGSPEHPETRRKAESAPPDPYGFSPRAPRCTARWRELLGLKRVQGPKPGAQATAAAPAAAPAASSKKANSRSSVKLMLHRNQKPGASPDASQSAPLLQGSDHEHVATAASRLSLSSSSSSGPDQEDIARLSVDSDKPAQASRASLGGAAARARGSGSPNRRAWNKQSAGSPSSDSPRVSSSGRILFHGLERSSSSPGGFARPRRPRGVERSYSAHVRVTPVLNVVPVRSFRGSSKPVCVFGFPHLFSPQQRKEGRGRLRGGSGGSGPAGTASAAS